MSGSCYQVPPMSRLAVREVADTVRRRAGVTHPWFPIMEYMEWYHLIEPTFELHVQELGLMGADHGRTYPDENLMEIREDVFDGATAGNGRDRMTVAHELGHLLLHKKLGFARIFPEAQIKPFQSSEWQAKSFAGELLIPLSHISLCADEYAAAQLFEVSVDAARTQMAVYRKEGFIR